jgi:NAD+ kinase
MRRVRRIGILGHARRPAVRRVARDLQRRLTRAGYESRLDAGLAGELGVAGEPLRLLARWCDVLVTLGGDGTVLTGARAAAGTSAILLPINLGGLGFLTAAESTDLAAALRHALAGRWPVERRRMLSALVRRRGRTAVRGVAMNDVAVKAAGGRAAVHLRLAALGGDLGHLVADGLIVASAAGSTAYSLSAGGPVLAPDVEGVVVTPVCPHSIGSRALVLAPGADVEIAVLGSLDRVALLLDGQESVDLAAKDEVRVRLDGAAVRVFRNPARPFAQTLRRKLGWQGSAKRSL